MPHPTTQLSVQERRIVQLAAEGLTNDEIAAHMNLARCSIAKSFERIYRKLGVRSARQEAIWRYMQHGTTTSYDEDRV